MGGGTKTRQGDFYLGFLLGINMVNTVNGLYFLAVPHTISGDQHRVSARMLKDRLGARSHWFRSCSWKKLSRSNESLRIHRHGTFSRAHEKWKMEIGYTHVVFRSHLSGNEDVRTRYAPKIGMGIRDEWRSPRQRASRSRRRCRGHRVRRPELRKGVILPQRVASSELERQGALPWW